MLASGQLTTYRFDLQPPQNPKSPETEATGPWDIGHLASAPCGALTTTTPTTRQILRHVFDHEHQRSCLLHPNFAGLGWHLMVSFFRYWKAHSITERQSFQESFPRALHNTGITETGSSDVPKIPKQSLAVEMAQEISVMLYGLGA